MSVGVYTVLEQVISHHCDLTKLLRDHTQMDVVWVWDHAQQQALDVLMKTVTNIPVLCYNNLQEEVTVQCDSSQLGLGAALMQNGQPVAYTSQVLTSVQDSIHLNREGSIGLCICL